MTLADLAALSARLGRDAGLIQGAGGNTSIKLDGMLWVKASGTWLADAETRPIFAALDLQAWAHREDGPAPSGGEAGLRPSIETSLHALMPHRVVLHVHSIAALAWAVRRDAAARLAERLDGLSWTLVPYRRPGLPLTRAAAESAPADVLVLQNHGLVIGGASCAEAAERLAEVERRLAVPIRPAPPADLRRLAALSGPAGLAPPQDARLHRLACDPDSLRLAAGGVLYPDHAVFLGPRFLLADDWDGASEPPYLAWPGVGVAVNPALSPGAAAMLLCLALLAERLDPAAALRYLDQREVAELTDWDAERYRRALDRGGN